MDFGNITNAAQDLVKNAQGMMNSNPDLLNKAEQMTGMDLNQDGTAGGVILQNGAIVDDSTLIIDSTSDKAVTPEETDSEETQDEVIDEATI